MAKTDRVFHDLITHDGAIADVPEFARAIAETGMYWLILLHGKEWEWIIKRLVREYFPDAEATPNALDFLSGDPDKFPRYGAVIYHDRPQQLHFMWKERVPVEDLCRRFGLDKDLVEQAAMVQMRPMADVWVKEPTVPYFGEG